MLNVIAQAIAAWRVANRDIVARLERGDLPRLAAMPVVAFGRNGGVAIEIDLPEGTVEMVRPS
jgi:hypothetical protein